MTTKTKTPKRPTITADRLEAVIIFLRKLTTMIVHPGIDQFRNNRKRYLRWKNRHLDLLKQGAFVPPQRVLDLLSKPSSPAIVDDWPVAFSDGKRMDIVRDLLLAIPSDKRSTVPFDIQAVVEQFKQALPELEESVVLNDVVGVAYRNSMTRGFTRLLHAVATGEVSLDEISVPA